MAAQGFLEQRPASPSSFAMVLLLHGAAIAGVLMIKDRFQPAEDTTLEAINIAPERIPDEIPPPTPPEVEQRVEPQRRVLIDAPRPVVPTPTPTPGPVTDPNPQPVEWASTIGTAATGSSTAPVAAEVPVRRPDPPAVPVRRLAEFDPRFARELQPPYPAVEQRNEREGSVRVQVTIGTNGRVLAVQRLSATTDAFFQATERQALSRWRFRPATVDGRPVESTKVLTVHFRLDQ